MPWLKRFLSQNLSHPGLHAKKYDTYVIQDIIPHPK